MITGESAETPSNNKKKSNGPLAVICEVINSNDVSIQNIHTGMIVYICIYVYMYIYICMYVSMHICIHTYKDTYVNTYIQGKYLV